MIHLFYAVFHIVRGVRKFDFRLVINETPSKLRPMGTRSYSDSDSCI
jgi:hypothetical protein